MRTLVSSRTAATLILVMSIAAPAAAAQASVSPAEQSAFALVQAGDWPKALSAYSALATAEPDNPRAIFWKGAALAETGQAAGAIPLLQRALDLGYQPAPQVHYRLARAYATAGETDKAFVELEGLAANGFANLGAMQHRDFASLPEDRFTKIVADITRNAHPCDADPQYHRFDFWIGTWDVQQTGVPRAASGATSVIERQLDGCVVQENWMPASGPQGKSFNIYNRTTKQWEQYWVDAGGRITHYVGAFDADGNLRFEADEFGGPNKVKMTFFPQGPNQVRQLGQMSTDGGKTWTVTFDLTYIRK
jgi:hypothetical protein